MACIRSYNTKSSTCVLMLVAIKLSYHTLLLWVAVLNTNMLKIKYARPKILAGHLVGSRWPKMGPLATVWESPCYTYDAVKTSS